MNAVVTTDATPEEVESVSKTLSIGVLAKHTGVNIETIRFYEKQGILPVPSRSSSGRRLYGGEDLKRLSFIHQCRKLGFSLKEVESLINLVDSGDYTCEQVHEITAAHAKEVKQKIKSLTKMESVLDGMVEQCSRGKVPDCPIIDSLYGD